MGALQQVNLDTIQCERKSKSKYEKLKFSNIDLYVMNYSLHI